MAREKANYRSMLSYLINERGFPMVLTKKQAAEVLGVSKGKLYGLIADGDIKVQGGSITIGSVASFLCD